MSSLLESVSLQPSTSQEHHLMIIFKKKRTTEQMIALRYNKIAM